MSSGIPKARWQSPEQFHITLQFLGQVRAAKSQRLVKVLDELDAPAFQTCLQGCGVFPHRGPVRALWLGVQDPAPFEDLHRWVTQAAQRCALEVERRRFTPHLTLARFSRRPSQALLSEWMEHHFAYKSAPFVVRSVNLYSSVLGSSGARYRVEASFPLDCETLAQSEDQARKAAWKGLWPLPAGGGTGL